MFLQKEFNFRLHTKICKLFLCYHLYGFNNFACILNKQYVDLVFDVIYYLKGIYDNSNQNLKFSKKNQG
jgi:hypothetical protein